MSTTRYKTAEDFDWYKHYPASFSTTTSHLSHVELGVYRRLLDHYWVSDNKLPAEAFKIAERIGEKVFNWRRYGITAPAGFDNEEVTIKIVEHVLSEFFEKDDNGNWHHIWLDEYRQASDAAFKERSQASRERAARQARAAGGRFGKVPAVPDGEILPCATEELTVPNGEGPVEQSTDSVDTGEAEGDQIDESTEDAVRVPDGAVDSLHSKDFPAVIEFPPETIPPRGPERYKFFVDLDGSDPHKARRFQEACKLQDAARLKLA